MSQPHPPPWLLPSLITVTMPSRELMDETRGGAADLIESHRAPAIVYCVSVSPIVRCVSAIVRRMPGSVSDNVRRNV